MELIVELISVLICFVLGLAAAFIGVVIRRQRLARWRPLGTAPQNVSLTWKGTTYDVTDTGVQHRVTQDGVIVWRYFGPPQLRFTPTDSPVFTVLHLPGRSMVEVPVIREADGTGRFLTPEEADRHESPPRPADA